MAGAKFTMNSNWERDLNRLVDDAVHDVARDYQRMFDRLGRQFEGRPVAEIKPVLRREWASVGGSISDPELTDYATLISAGTHIKMRVER